MKNSYHFIFIPFLFTIFFNSNVISQHATEKSIEETQTVWLKALQNSESLELFYTENSGVMINDTLYIGLHKITQQLQKLEDDKQFESYAAKETYQLRENQKFELGEYNYKNGKTHSSIIGWKKSDTWTKEFEVIYEKNSHSNSQLSSVNNVRDKWSKLANQHRPDLIVSQVTSKNGKYFNRGNKYKLDEIAKAYGYMSEKSFKIKLKPLKVLQVNDSIVFDIGTFEARGKGLYTLIWKKEDGNWKMLLDFNF